MLLDLLAQSEYYQQSAACPHALLRLLQGRWDLRDVIGCMHSRASTYGACCITVSTMTPLPWGKLTCMGCPPTTHLQYRLEGTSSWLPCWEHLPHTAWPTRAVHVSSQAYPNGANFTDLSSWEVVTCCQCRRPPVQRGGAIFLRCALRQVWEAEEARLLRLALLLEVLGVHRGCPALSNGSQYIYKNAIDGCALQSGVSAQVSKSQTEQEPEG